MEQENNFQNLKKGELKNMVQENNKSTKGNVKYNIGLDIGTGSVGWCVTDDNYNILKYKNKNMWGSHIFNTAETAASRRMFRGSRRRLDRRKMRISLLKNLTKDDMNGQYPNFFALLNETYKTYDDKTIAEDSLSDNKKIKYNLFPNNDIELDYNDVVKILSLKNDTLENNSIMNERAYYKLFPTIYHLRKYLTETDKQVDFRLVYLAIHHIIKYRGNFLHEGDFSKDTTEVESSLNKVLEFLISKYGIELKNNNDTQTFLEILKIKSNRSEKIDKIKEQFDIQMKDEKSIIAEIAKAILGNKFKLDIIFGTSISDEYKSISFSSEIEDEEKLKDELDINSSIYDALKNIYSWYSLQDILQGEKYLSSAMIKRYNQYALDLKQLKHVYKEYFPQEYSYMFRKDVSDKNLQILKDENADIKEIKEKYKNSANYYKYNGKDCKKCSAEDFYKFVKAKIKELPDDCKEKDGILEKIDNNEFLRKINITENGAIPYQLHKIELEKILEKQSKYYKTLEENKDKILSLLTFRIPYYVGPLASENYVASRKDNKGPWLVRNSNDHIRPWNFDEIVNKDETAEKFIRRMTNKCQYLLDEDVLPKQSLLYSEYTVLNELNNIKVNDKKISSDMKKEIIEKLFKRQKTVTKSKLENLYKIEGIEVKSITGFQEEQNSKFLSNMSSYIDMRKRLYPNEPDRIDIDEDDLKMCEDIIYWITIFEDKKILKHKIEKSYGDKSKKPRLTKSQIDELVKLNFTGWARFSKNLLDGIKSNDGKNETIIEKLRNTKLNFMQIINDETFGYKKQIEEKLKEYIEKDGEQLNYNIVDELPTSPANKRAIWRSLLIVKEISKIMGCNPQNIYIEFARNEEEKGKLKSNRSTKLLKIYDDIDKQSLESENYNHNVYKELKIKIKEKSDFTERLYLYFIQNGKCMYSGRPLDIEKLSDYQVDHILPQSYIKDDSLDNKALVIMEENQRKKDNLLLSDEIINKQMPFWKFLFEKGLISQTKYFRLIRRKVNQNDDEAKNFINRQIVETRQITKYVAQIINNAYKDTSVFTLRAQLTHWFREKYNIYKNRDLNDYHHAHDAYIISIIGNVIDNSFAKYKDNFKYGAYLQKYIQKQYEERQKNKGENFGVVLYEIAKNVNDKIPEIKKKFYYKDCNVTNMLEEATGEFYNQNLSSKNDKTSIPVKEGMDCSKYGGYSQEQRAYICIYEYTDKKGKQYKIVGIPIQVATSIKEKKTTIYDYIYKTYIKNSDFSNLKIIQPKILIGQNFIDKDGNELKFQSEQELKYTKQLVVNEEIAKQIYLMNNQEKKDDKIIERNANEEINYEKIFDYLIEKIRKEYKFSITSNAIEKLQSKKETFMALDDKSKKDVINNLIMIVTKASGNFKKIGMGDREGRISQQKFSTEKLKNITFINKSITGLYENRYKLEDLS